LFLTLILIAWYFCAKKLGIIDAEKLGIASAKKLGIIAAEKLGITSAGKLGIILPTAGGDAGGKGEGFGAP